MRGHIPKGAKHLLDLTASNIDEFTEQIYKEAQGIKERVASLTPGVQKYILPSNPADVGIIIITALPSAGYLIDPSEGMLKTISVGLLFYAILTPMRVNEYNERKK